MLLLGWIIDIIHTMHVDDGWDKCQHQQACQCVDSKQNAEAFEASRPWLAAELIELVLGPLGKGEWLISLIGISLVVQYRLVLFT